MQVHFMCGCRNLSCIYSNVSFLNKHKAEDLPCQSGIDLDIEAGPGSLTGACQQCHAASFIFSRCHLQAITGLGFEKINVTENIP